MNAVTFTDLIHYRYAVGSLPGGTLVKWKSSLGSKEHLYVVLTCKTGGIAAVSLEDGCYLTSEEIVTPLHSGDKITLEVK